MMNFIFSGMLIFSFVFAVLTGRVDQLSQSVLKQAGNAVELVLSLLGMLCLWGGIMRIAQESKLTEKLSKALSPVTGCLFRGLKPGGRAMRAVTMNLVANFLGLGNAATPLGIQAICEMRKEQGTKGTATNEMAMFVVLNTASLQLIPTTTAMLRMQYGSAAPLDILPAVWLASIGSITVGVVMAKTLEKVWRKCG